jgi:hypothetical protein
MAIVVEDGTFSRRVIYAGWAEWRELRRDRPDDAPLVPAGVASGATCWGNGRYLQPAANGEGLVPRACPAGGSGLAP